MSDPVTAIVFVNVSAHLGDPALMEWLECNDIDAPRVPARSTIAVYDSGADGPVIEYDRYLWNASGRTYVTGIPPHRHVAREVRKAPLKVEVPEALR